MKPRRRTNNSRKARSNGKRPSIPYAPLITGAAALLYFLLYRPIKSLQLMCGQKAEDIMKDVYGKIVGISTIAAIVTASVALLIELL